MSKKRQAVFIPVPKFERGDVVKDINDKLCLVVNRYYEIDNDEIIYRIQSPSGNFYNYHGEDLKKTHRYINVLGEVVYE